MKRTLIIALFALFTLTASAQAYWSIGMGYDHTYLRGYNCTSMNLDGFHIGPEFRYDFFNGKGFGIGTAIYYRYVETPLPDRHETFDDSKDSSWPIMAHYTQCKYGMHYIHIPLYLTYTHHFYQDWSLTAFLGPAYDWGIADHERKIAHLFYEDGTQDPHLSTSASFPIDQDVTLDLGLGFRYKHLAVKATYSFGFMPILYNFDWNEAQDHLFISSKHLSQNLSLHIAYQF